MDTLIIQVDFNGRAKPYQLGIEVVPPDARASNQQPQRQQQAASKARSDSLHEYQNFDQLTPNHQKQSPHKSHQLDLKQNGQNVLPNSLRTSSTSSPTTISSPSRKSLISARYQGGLLITKIYKCSVIDQNGQFRVGDIIIEVNGINFQARTFQEAQKILKTFVEQPSHGPLFLTVLRRAASSSSLLSTTGSQNTVIERLSEPKNKSHTMSLSSSTSSKKLSSNSTSTPSPRSSSSARHLGGALNTRRIGTIYSIKLKKSSEGGFGIKIAERDNMFGSNRPIYITAITTTGSAYRDGRLREGDMLLEVNGIDVSGTSQPEVTKMLKGVSINETVEFVVSRLENDHEQNLLRRELNGNATVIENKDDLKQSKDTCDNSKSLIDLDVPDQEDSVFSDNHQFEKKIDSILNVPTTDGPGIYIYDIPLNDTKSAGLGLYLKCPTLDRKDLGIWIEKVITGGAAWKDGRLLPDDQILAINGINLMGLSNVKAYETLTAAVCRGIGPEATANTIRLNIHRRDPSVVKKILLGTNNRIEHSDLPANGHNKSNSTVDKTFNNTIESYQTALDNTIHSRSQSSNETSGGGSNKSSSQTSQNDSAMSPQTQASNSIKMSNSGNEKSEHNSSDHTNDTSSAVSQITDFTTVPITSDTTPEKDSNNQLNNENHQANAFTLPKTLEVGDGINEVDPSSSIQSWDEESIDDATGEERFQRDGFGRRSISEKRHAQLMATNTDTYRRNQKIREERDKQRLINEQLERMRLDDADKRYSLNITGNFNNQRMSNPMPMVHDSHSIYGMKQDRLNHNGILHQDNHREVPVDVHLPAVEHHLDIAARQSVKHHSHHHLHHAEINDFEDLHHRSSNHHISNYNQQQRNSQYMMMNQCVMCGAIGACLCQVPGNVQQVPRFYVTEPTFDGSMLKRSNSLESIQQHHSHYMHENQQIRKGLIVPRAGTVRVARNRKINESFRAAVDRSYDGSTHDSGRSDNLTNNEHGLDVGEKRLNSVAISTASISNDEKHLSSSTNNNSITSNSQNKKSSLLTKFLKLGSMKKSKKKNKDSQMDSKLTHMDNSKLAKETLNCENTRSQASKSSQSKTKPAQSHQNSINQQQQLAMQMKTDNINGQAQFGHNRIKQQQQPMQSQQSHTRNSIDLHHNHPLRASLNMLQYHQFQQQAQQNHLSHTLTHPKLGANVPIRPTTILHNTNHMHQYSGHNLRSPPVSLTSNSHQFPSVELQNRHQLHQYQATGNRNHLIQNLNVQNACNAPPVSNQWQQPPIQTPNGLWVANATLSEPQMHQHQQQLQHNSIYRTHNHSVTQMHNSHPTVTLSSHHHHPSPFIPQTTAGNNNCQQNLNGMVHHHQPPVLQGQVPTMTQQQHLHNQQPQHIYYYDF